MISSDDLTSALMAVLASRVPELSDDEFSVLTVAIVAICGVVAVILLSNWLRVDQ